MGVVVFDVNKGAAVSFNRETRRIVDGLRDPEQAPEDLLGMITVRRADGSEVSLHEFPLADLLGSSETVRAEEIVMGVPDGRSVTVLLNATPIRSDEGELESVVVTMQDMTDVEEQGRLRAEFLAMVSHELRTPLATVKGTTTSLLSGSDTDPAVAAQFHRIMDQQVDHMQYLIGDLLDVPRIQTGALPVDPEPSELYLLVEEAGSRFRSADAMNPLEVELAAHRPGAGQPALQRRRVLARRVADNGDGGAGGCPRCGLRRRPGTGHTGGASAGAVPQVPARRRHRALTGRVWVSPSARASSRPTGAASGPRATGLVWEPSSPSPCRRWSSP